VTLLRFWLAASGILLAGLMVWAFAPMLLLMALLIGGLGLVAAFMIGLARRLGAWRERRRG
jgi:hypothetical protein